MANKKILTTGVSGTGKSTVHREFLKRNIRSIDTDSISHWINKETGEKMSWKVNFTKEFLSQHDWECDIDALHKALTEEEGDIVVCGSCDNIEECMKLFGVTLLLHCPPEVFIERVQSRKDNQYGKDEAALNALLGYYQEYNTQCLEAGAVPIDATQAIQKVVSDVESYLR